MTEISGQLIFQLVTIYGPMVLMLLWFMYRAEKKLDKMIDILTELVKATDSRKDLAEIKGMLDRRSADRKKAP